MGLPKVLANGSIASVDYPNNKFNYFFLYDEKNGHSGSGYLLNLNGQPTAALLDATILLAALAEVNSQLGTLYLVTDIVISNNYL